MEELRPSLLELKNSFLFIDELLVCLRWLNVSLISLILTLFCKFNSFNDNLEDFPSSSGVLSKEVGLALWSIDLLNMLPVSYERISARDCFYFISDL